MFLASPSAERVFRERHEIEMRQGTADDERRAPGKKRRRVKANDVVERQRAQRRVVADGQMAIRVCRIQQLEKCALRERGRQVFQLPEALEAKLADALEIGVA